jgi:hypothetical protein
MGTVNSANSIRVPWKFGWRVHRVAEIGGRVVAAGPRGVARAGNRYERLGFELEVLRASKMHNQHGRVMDHNRMLRPAGD